MNLRGVFLILFVSGTVMACDILCPPEPEDNNRKARTDSASVESLTLFVNLSAIHSSLPSR